MKSIKNISKNVQSLCKPAYFYFVISVVTMIFMMLQNLTEGKNVLCLGEYKCTTTGAPLVFIGQTVYILIWTKVLDMLCNRLNFNFMVFIFFLNINVYFISINYTFAKINQSHNQSVVGMSMD